MRRVIIHWGISSFFGWGVYGLNLALHWAADPDLQAFCSFPIGEDQIAVDKLRRRALDPFVIRSGQLVADLGTRAGRTITVDSPLLAALGNDFRTTPGAHGVRLSGSPDVGVVFFEVPQMDAETLARAKAFKLIVAGSTWNEKILREYGLDNVTTVIQGIDPTLFHPAPRLGTQADRFLVFSGGKLELRKGQDLVVAAFARFARRHPEALLVTAWHSPWPQFARTLDQSGRAAPIPFDANGKAVDTAAWARANGIADDQFLDLGAVPNAFMPPILREMDVALFPNRSEGGTNLVAMECMACGVPTILSANTGHLDLIDDDACFPLRRQTAVAGAGAAVGGTAGWGESSVDDIVEALEQAHADRAEARRRGAGGAEMLADLTWSRTAAAMKRIVLSLA
ncbi:glycosyltransferase [Siculibacillus lacustris]|uniref:Glycosyltransferase n=1 Tax=Siculibacillus lacustris TaxID=1549641 RepID=A0A4Q9VFA0_9HYPH|nr:glycosyltransferase family 4 protein [Siculibacillus lacustris]TBW33562.1 glycosyltransferase [Siculibacillus lacustris]